MHGNSIGQDAKTDVKTCEHHQRRKAGLCYPRVSGNNHMERPIGFLIERVGTKRASTKSTMRTGRVRLERNLLLGWQTSVHSDHEEVDEEEAQD